MIQEPIQPTPASTTAAETSSRRTLAIKFGLLAAAVILLAIPIVMATAAFSPSTAPTRFLGAGASAAPSPGRAGTPEGGKGEGKGHRADGNRDGRGSPSRGPITIRAIGGSQVSLATDDGWTRTITISTSTVITKGGVTIGIVDLKVGDEIGFREKRGTDGSYAITSVTVVTPRAGGEVTKVDGSDITVQGRDGSRTVIHVSTSTVYKGKGLAATTLADLAIGDYVIAEGTRRSDGSLDAVTVYASPGRGAKPPKAPAPTTSSVPG